MKKCFIATALICACISANAQFTSHSGRSRQSDYLSSLPEGLPSSGFIEAPGIHMRNTGRTLTIFGAVLFVAGAAMASTADALYYNSSTTYSSSGSATVKEGDPRGGYGVALMAGGVGMMVPGIIFWSKGSKKYRHYQEQQSTSVAFKNAGISLQFHF
jgi:hypothetical protein